MTCTRATLVVGVVGIGRLDQTLEKPIVPLMIGALIAGGLAGGFSWLGSRELRREAKKLRSINNLIATELDNAGLIDARFNAQTGDLEAVSISKNFDIQERGKQSGQTPEDKHDA